MKNLKIICMVVGVACLPSFSFGQAENYITLDFEIFTLGEQPDLTLFPPDVFDDPVSEEFIRSLLRFTPASNTDDNGVVVIDDSFDPPNPLSGKSLLIYDRNSNGPTHFRFPFYWGPPDTPAEATNGSEVGVVFDFQRAWAVDAADTDTGIHVALGRVGDPLNNSDFRPFELRILNNGNLVLDSLEGTQTIGRYDVTSANRLAIMANSHDADDTLTYNHDLFSDRDIDDEVLFNSLHVWLNGEKLGEYDFHVTPGGPGINFTQEEFDLGQIAFYQDTGRQGGIVIDNLSIGGSEEDDDDGDNGGNGGGPGPTTKLINISARAFVGTGAEVLIGGFIIGGDGEQEVLVQARGPELVNDGIANALADPVLTVTNATTGEVLMENDNWEDDVGQRQRVIDAWGGSPNMAAGSLSSAAYLNLDPGNYTGKVEGKNGTTGVALVEVYEID